MAKDTVFAETKQLDRLTIELKGFEKEVGQATYYALNRTIDYTITQVGRIIPKSYAIKASEVKDSFKGGVKKPSKTDLTASLTSTGHTLSFAHFPFKPKTDKRGKRSVFQNAVTVTIKKAKGNVLVKKGFVAKTGAKSKDKTQYNVWMRLGTFSTMTKGRYEGQQREEIAPIRTLSIPQMITNDGVAEQIQQAAMKKLDERLEHEIARIMTSMDQKIRR